MRDKIKYIIISLLIFCSVISAQRGDLVGKVIDSNNKEPIIGATVRIVGTNMGMQTDVDGEYYLPNLRPGIYKIQVSYIGYHTKTITDITITSGKINFQIFELDDEGVQLNWDGDCFVCKKLIEKSEAATSYIITQEDIKSLPTRSISSIIGIVGAVNMISGMSSSANLGATIIQ